MITRPDRITHGILRSFLCIPVLLVATVLLSANTSSLSPVLRASNNTVLILDAAHGGEDPGSKSIYGDLEKDLSLAISQKLVSLSNEYNVKIISTRENDVSHTLEERLQVCNSIDDALFISIHVGKKTAEDPPAYNYKLNISSKNSHYNESLVLASAIANRLKNQKLPVEVVDNAGVFMIRENKHPSLLIECGNIDDADNISLLKNKISREKFCRNILAGIVEYQARLNKK